MTTLRCVHNVGSLTGAARTSPNSKKELRQFCIRFWIDSCGAGSASAARKPLLGIGRGKCRGNLYHRCRGIQDGTSILGEWWVNPLAVDRLLGSLGRFTNRSDSSIPSLRVNCSPKTKVQHSNVPLDTQRQHGFPKQIANDIVAGETAHWAAVLTGHD